MDQLVREMLDEFLTHALVLTAGVLCRALVIHALTRLTRPPGGTGRALVHEWVDQR